MAVASIGKSLKFPTRAVGSFGYDHTGSIASNHFETKHMHVGRRTKSHLRRATGLSSPLCVQYVALLAGGLGTGNKAP